MGRLVGLVVGDMSARVIAVMIYDAGSDRLPPTVACKQRLSDCHQTRQPTDRFPCVHAYHYA
jgi:hypothetical protein